MRPGRASTGARSVTRLSSPERQKAQALFHLVAAESERLLRDPGIKRNGSLLLPSGRALFPGPT
jgi:hypothetical protein